jgi:uncharacterized membrane protein YeaQ/YmgE (transglycosylase-associated protein family)
MNRGMKVTVTLLACAVFGAVFGMTTSGLLGSTGGLLGAVITGGVGTAVGWAIWRRLSNR